MRFVREILGALLLLSFAGLDQGAHGQDRPPAPAAAQPAEMPLTMERIETLRKEAEASSELDDEKKKKVAEICRSASVELQRAAELKARAAAFNVDAETAQQRVVETKQRLDDLKGKQPALPDAGQLPELEQVRSKLELQLETQKKRQVAAESEPKSRAQRRKEIRTHLVSIPERLVELKKQADSLPADEQALVATVRKFELAVRRHALENESPALENELTKYEAEDAADLIRLDRDLCTQEVALTERHLKLLDAQIKKDRAIEAEQAVRKARDEAIAAHSVLKAHAERNRQLTEKAKLTTEQFDATDRDLKAAKETHDRLVRQFEQTRKKVESVGLTSSIGALLRKQRASLPEVRGRQAAIHGRRTTIDETQYELFEYDDERQELANPEMLVQRIVANAGSHSTYGPELLEAAAREVLDRKREYLDALIRNYNQYFDALVELDTVDQQIVHLARQYQQYIDERVLWIRSGKLLTAGLEFDQSDSWFVSSYRWAEVPQQLGKDLRETPIWYFLVSVTFCVLFVRRKHLRHELREIGQTVQRPTCYLIRPTLRGVGLTAAVAALWPGVIGFVAWRLYRSADTAPFAKAIGHGLLSLSLMWFPLELFRQISRPHGLGTAHFNWPCSAAQVLRRNLRWLILLGLPLTFVTSTLFAADPTHGRDAVERICFILEGIVLAVFLRCVLRPYGGVFQEYIAYNQGGWIDRLKYVWYWVGVSAPLLISGLAFWGYYYTAQVLSWRLYVTISFVALLVLIRALLQRLIMLRRRKLSIEQTRQRVAAQAEEMSTASPPAGIVAELPQADLTSHSVQTQRMLATGMLATTLVGFWLIWVDVLPALSMLDRWPLWTTAATLQVVEDNTPPLLPTRMMGSQPEPAAAVRTELRTTSVTFSHVALAVLVAVITCMSARNVPGLLEMAVLQRLPLDASVRYAITSLVSYGIVLLGIIVTCSSIGLRWSQVQWLATALTFGLAFGLQEIFANFVAGIIILFERPVRVGDVVTVDDVSGVVSRIRIRATAITNWDRKEYVVPNKEFITGRLLNWTLSDRVNRVLICVGIAFGSDTEKARELLLQTANEHPLTLKDPPSLATFEGFGDNSLNFTLRTFLPTMENRLQVIHELHTSIDQAFRKANIEIAFPQRDLHIRSVTDALGVAVPQPHRQDDMQNEAA